MKQHISFTWIIVLSLCGCAQVPQKVDREAAIPPSHIPRTEAGTPPPPAQPVQPLIVPLHDDLPPTPIPVGNVLDRIRQGMALPTVEHHWVREEREWFMKREGYLHLVFGRSQRYLHFITDEVQRRGLPMELALLPLVESAFNPFAYSRSHASGLWQFIPETGRRYGLRQDWWQDQRRDPVLSTHAALEYLQRLSNFFEGDWLLAIAAYNCGAGRVRQEIQRNQRQGKPTDFFSLRLPKETRAYLPKLLALAAVVKDPVRYGLTLPEVPDAPYFVGVDTEGPVDLRVAAQLAGVEVDELHALNAGWNQWITAPEGPHRLFLPTVVAPRFQQQLAALPPHARAGLSAREAGDIPSLDALAKQSGTPVEFLRQFNEGSENLTPDKLVFTPTGQTSPLREGLFRTSTESYRVKAGDSLWSIARRHGMSVSKLASLNGISQRATLHPGQRLWVSSQASSRRGVQATKQALIYKVQHGDTLSSIARRFAVTIANIQAWNGMGRGTTIRAGQRLTIHTDNRRNFGG